MIMLDPNFIGNVKDSAEIIHDDAEQKANQANEKLEEAYERKNRKKEFHEIKGLKNQKNWNKIRVKIFFEKK
jgi:hypothetical protein